MRAVFGWSYNVYFIIREKGLAEGLFEVAGFKGLVVVNCCCSHDAHFKLRHYWGKALRLGPVVGVQVAQNADS
eukprot:5042861-Ditylum_brightwellii.AAC.1